MSRIRFSISFILIILADVNKPKVTAEDLFDFLVATPVNTMAMEVQMTNPVGTGESLNDTYTLLLHRMWSGKHHAVVKGIDLLTLLWTDGERHLLRD